MKEVTMPIAESLIIQFNRVWEMLRGAIEAIPDRDFKTGDLDYLIPARLCMHIIEPADAYASPGYEGYVSPSKHLNGTNEPWPIDMFPDRRDMLKYHEEVGNKFSEWIRSTQPALWESFEPTEERTGGTRLGAVIYILRHSQYHLGELYGEMRRRGIPRPGWR